MNVLNIEPTLAIFLHAGSSNFGGAIGRVVQNLDLQKLARISHIASCLDKPFHNVHFVVNRKLYRDSRFYFQLCMGVRSLILVFQVKKHQMISVNTINGENGQDREIWDQDENVESAELVKAVPVIDRRKLKEMRAFRRKNQSHR